MKERDLAKKLFSKKHGSKEIADRFFIKKSKIYQFLLDILEILYPHFNQNYIQSEEDLLVHIQRTKLNLVEILHDFTHHNEAEHISNRLFNELETIRDLLDLDVDATFRGDPAAKSCDEIILCYPGFLAITIHRIAHLFYQMNVPILPRLCNEYSHQLTGIDIHPGATIGNNFFIDHGTGIVIGETTVIGNNVKIYQGVTLGALSLDKKENSKRHPTIEDNCIIYSNATILGGKTVIGANSIIGGNVWLTKSISPNSIVYHQSKVKMDLHARNSDANEEDLYYEI